MYLLYDRRQGSGTIMYFLTSTRKRSRKLYHKHWHYALHTRLIGEIDLTSDRHVRAQPHTTSLEKLGIMHRHPSDFHKNLMIIFFESRNLINITDEKSVNSLKGRSLAEVSSLFSLFFMHIFQYYHQIGHSFYCRLPRFLRYHQVGF